MTTIHRIAGILLAFVCSIVFASALTFAQETPPRFRALVIAERGDIHEPFVDAALEWLQSFAREQRFEYDVFENPDAFDKEFLAKYQVFIQLNYPPYRWSGTAKAAFEDYIEEGRGGWVGMHHASLLGEFDGFEMWNWFSHFLGEIRFKNYIAKRVSGTVHVEAPEHPCFQGLPEEFVVDEEEWYTFDKNPRPNVQVLANVDESSYTPASDIKMGDHPVVWSNEKMKARNIYFLMGHHPSIIKNEHFTKLLGNSILWAAEKNVPAAFEPSVSKRTIHDPSSPYHFDGPISREVLERYLDRSVTMAYLLVTGKIEGNREYPYRDDDLRLIKNLQPKLIGRAIYRWNGESRLNDPEFWENAQSILSELHAHDPEIIFQGCLFETISKEVEQVPIPPYVFSEFGLPVVDRCFSYDNMLNESGRLVNHWGRASVPDISREETQMWFYYLATAYIKLGCEALHLGQVGLIGMNDPGLLHWQSLIHRIRVFAAQQARRHWVLLDAHVPSGGMIVEGTSLLDFNSFPLRIKEKPEHPYEAELEMGHLDGIYGRSKGCIAPSGWGCESLPYLVEFDNFGRGPKPNAADPKSIFVWGWDEISWFSLQSEQYRNDWLVYAHEWIRKNDPNGHLQMPIHRMITCPNQSSGSYRANERSDACPIGYSQEGTIKKIWGAP